jgi:hypothetical protein
VLAAFVLPRQASAHVVGGAPVATNFEARILGLTPSSEAVDVKVVDGDRALWLRSSANATVVIRGAEGEPLLRFAAGGVFLNLRSVTAQSDRIDRFDLRPDPDPRARPLWHRLTSAHAYRWHDHRLHALEPLARSRRTETVLGPWSIPVVIDGRPHRLSGVLVYRPPGPVWQWILLACVLGVAVTATLALPVPIQQRTAVSVALSATLLIWALRIAREVYGRPGVGASGYVATALTSAAGAALLFGLLHPEAGVRMFVALLVGFGCLYQGLTMLPAVTHSIALMQLPTPVSRAAVAAVLGLGGGLLAVSVRRQFAAE